MQLPVDEAQLLLDAAHVLHDIQADPKAVQALVGVSQVPAQLVQSRQEDCVEGHLVVVRLLRQGEVRLLRLGDLLDLLGLVRELLGHLVRDLLGLVRELLGHLLGHLLDLLSQERVTPLLIHVRGSVVALVTLRKWGSRRWLSPLKRATRALTPQR
jgi:hypothetical protein